MFELSFLNGCLLRSEKGPARGTPIQHSSAEIHLGQDSQKTLSLGKQNIHTPTQQNVGNGSQTMSEGSLICRKRGMM